jgi:osmotically-inducible protein OsmY
MRWISRVVFGAWAIPFLVGCGPTTERSATETRLYRAVPTAPLHAPATSDTVTTVTTAPDGTVTRRTTTTYYYPRRSYKYSSIDDDAIVSNVRAATVADPLVNAHSKNLSIGSYAGVVEIKGRGDSISTVEEASRDAISVPGVRQVNNDMVID